MKTPKYNIGDKLFYLWIALDEYTINCIRPTAISVEDGSVFYSEKSKTGTRVLNENLLFKDKHELFDELNKVFENYIPR